MGLTVSERTVLSSDGDSFWQFDGDHGVGNCSVSGPYYCGSNYTNRMYFEFAPTKLAGKYVLDATFRAKETWSFDCQPHMLDLVRTDNISEGTKWPGPKHLDLMGDRSVSAGRGDLCSPSQPDSWIEFNDSPSESDENLRDTVRSFADGKFSRLTLMLKAHDEGDAAAWKRFDDNAELSVTYMVRPGLPSAVGIVPGDGNTAFCPATTVSDPLFVTRTDPLVRAKVETQVQPTSAEHKGALQAEFVVQRQEPPGSSTWVGTWSGESPTVGWDPDGTLQALRIPHRADGLVYRYQARTQSHVTFNGNPYDLYSAYKGSASSPWCYFMIDTTRPKAPQIVPGDPYKDCAVTACGGPGLSGKFTFKPNAADSDIIGYKYGLISGSAADVKEVDGSTPPPQTVTPDMEGEQTLWVQARDVRERWGDRAEFKFKVAPPGGAEGRWNFNDSPPTQSGQTKVTVAKDSATEGTRHNATLFNAGSEWNELARRGANDYSLWLNDTTDPVKQQGYAAAPAAVDTGKSFTASAWVYLTDATANRVALSAPGSNASAFTLGYSASDKKWVFSRADRDVAASVVIPSKADTASPPLKVWTHLTGVFDTGSDTSTSDDTIQLFVNGRPQGAPVALAAEASSYEPWQAGGGLQFGRSVKAGAGGDYFKGRLDEVALWGEARSESLIRLETQALEGDLPHPELVAAWDATVSTGSTIKEMSPYPVAGMTLSASGATLDGASSTLMLDGTTGYARMTGPVVDETGSFTVTARARLDSLKWADKPVGYQAVIAAQRAGTAGEASWALWAEKRGNGIYWCFGRTAVHSAGNLTKSHVEAQEAVAEMDTSVQVTGVFDAHQPDEVSGSYGVNHLYVGDAEQHAGANAGFAAAQQGSGDLSAGRGTTAGVTGSYLPGALEEIRVWTGAMSADQVYEKITAPSGTGS
ncbi:LamG domain-containing protein [Streptomyces sp. A3M-1-3]|uniref:LamG domain-containing protein n=1 Tax=Streptomyces sp. A3M-1-3 TaxID=2962044 RepID=UPI0020B8CE5A|nr:LamG domain-containing protein [Streptomyces sp. A3M-1-3]MCP3822698.1 LamG domain-containing protein [Streptomyces sp. A3M-1-3]